jgi:DNA-directed RNA polymerase specialized sigma subunit
VSNFTSLISDIFDRGVEQRLSLEDERLAIELAQHGDQAAQTKLLLAYAPALRNGVQWFARALPSTPQRADLEDVRSQAILGFLEAIKAFSLNSHDRLAAIAPQYIRNAVAVSASSATSFTVPERTLKRFFGILREAEGNAARAADLAPSFEMKRDTFLAVLSAVRNVTSYDGLSSGGTANGASVHGWGDGENTKEPHAFPIWDANEAAVVDRILVEMAFTAVDELEAQVMLLAYGFTDYEPIPDAEVGHRLGFSRAKAQRTRTAALEKMRHSLGVAA